MFELRSLKNRCLMLVDNTNHCILVLPGYDTNRMWKYNTKTGKRIEIDIEYSEPSAFWKPYISGNCMYICSDTDDGSVSFFQPKSIQQKDELRSDDIVRLYVAGDTVYEFRYTTAWICIMDKETGRYIHIEWTEPLVHHGCCEYSHQWNSILLHDRHEKNTEYEREWFQEFDISTNQYIQKKWMWNWRVFNPLMMQCTADKRYVIVIDGANEDEERFECILVFDSKLQRSMRLPGRFCKDIHGAVMVNNDHDVMERDELLMFGFVNCSWKEPGFRELQPMPRYLIQMIGKWYCNETVYIVDKYGKLHSIRVDDIIQGYHHPSECPEDWLDICDHVKARKSSKNDRETITIESPMN